jgi:hypothetical protein
MARARIEKTIQQLEARLPYLPTELFIYMPAFDRFRSLHTQSFPNCYIQRFRLFHTAFPSVPYSVFECSIQRFCILLHTVDASPT